MTDRKRTATVVCYLLWTVASGTTFLFLPSAVTFSILLGTVLLPCLFCLFAFLQSRLLSLSCDVSRKQPLAVCAKVKWKGCFLPALLTAKFSVKNIFSGETGEEIRSFFLFDRGEGDFIATDLVGQAEQSLAFIVSDPLGIFRFSVKTRFSAVKFALPERTELSVRLRKTSDSLEEFYSRERLQTDGDERGFVREYREGEPVRDVHWKLSARSDSLYLSERTQPVANGVAILLLSPSTAAASYFFSLSEACVAAGISHSLFAPDERGEWREYPVSDAFGGFLAERNILSVPFFDGKASAPDLTERGFSHAFCVGADMDFSCKEVSL